VTGAPARDFGPRRASSLTGYSHAWRDQYGHLHYWVPIAGPIIGAVIDHYAVGRFPPTPAQIEAEAKAS
jgi:glycerol uptake facilitator protein